MFVPILFSFSWFVENQKYTKLRVLLLLVLAVLNIGHGLAQKYKEHSIIRLLGSENIIAYTQSILKAYNERIADDKYLGLFEFVSDATCADIYHFFKDTYKIETRVSIIQQYKDGEQNRCVMISRTSKKTQSLGQKKDDSEVKYESKKKHKYYKRILLDNKDNVIILFQHDINKFFFVTKTIKV